MKKFGYAPRSNELTSRKVESPGRKSNGKSKGKSKSKSKSKGKRNAKMAHK